MESEVKNPETAAIVKANRLHAAKILTTVIPTDKVMVHFADNIHDNEKEEKAAEKWAESYEDAIKVHSNTAERFEMALVCTEIGIVIASVGLLLVKKVWLGRTLWVTAVVLGVISMSVAGGTYVQNTKNLHAAEEKIKVSKAVYMEFLKEKQKNDEDKKMLEEIEKKRPEKH